MAQNLRWGVDLDTADGIRDAEQFFNALKAGGSTAADFLDKRFSGNSKYVVELQTVVNKDTGLKELVPQLRKINDETDKYSRELDKLNSIQRGSLTSLRQQRNEAAQTRDSYAKFVERLDAAGRSQLKLNQDWAQANQRVKELDASLAKAGASNFWQQIKADFNLGPLLSAAQGIGTLVNAFQAVSIVIQQITGSVGELFNRLSKLQAFGLVFQSIGQGVSGAAVALQEADRIALGAGANIDTVREAFQKVAPAILATGGNIGDVSKTVQALTTRFTALGKSQDEQRRAFNAVVQVFGKGKLQAEELTQQLGEVDSALKTDLAKAAGVSVAAFEELVRGGKITSQIFADLVKKIDKTDEVFGKLGPNATSAVQALGQGKVVLQQVLTQFNNLQTLNLQSLAQALQPFLGQLLAVKAAFIDLTTQVVNSEAFKTLVTVFNSTGGAINTLLITIINLTGVLLKVIEPFAALLNQLLQIPGVAQLIGAVIAGKLVGSLLSLTGVLSQNARDFGGFRGLLIGIADVIRNTGGAIDGLQAKGGLLQATMNALSGVLGKTTQSGATFQQALLGIGPAAVQTAAGVTQVAVSAGTAQGKASLFASVLNALGMSFGSLPGKTGGAKSGIDAVGNATSTAASKGGGFLQMALNLGNSFQSLGQKSGKAGGQAVQLGLDLQGAGMKAAEAATKGRGFQAFLGNAGGLVTRLVSLLNPLTIALALVAAGFAGFAENNRAANATTEASGKALAGLDAAMKSLGGSTEQTSQKMNPFASVMGLLGIAFEGLVENAKKTIQTIIQFGQAISGGVLGFVVNLGNSVKGLWDKFASGTAVGTAVNKIFGEIANSIKFLGQFFDGTIVKQFQLNKATEATGAAQLKFGASLDKTIEAYKRESAASDGSTESKKKLAEAGKQMIGAVQAEEARLKALADQYGLTGKDVSEMTEEERLLYNTLQAGNVQVEAAKRQLAAMGITAEGTGDQVAELTAKLKENAEAIKKVNEERIQEVKDNAEERIRNLDKEKEKVREASAARVEGLQRAKQAAADFHQGVISDLEEQKQRIGDAAQQQLDRIEVAKSKEDSRHSARMANLELEAQAIQRNYDKQLASIDAAIAAENRRYSNQIANINAPSAAERRLQEIEIEKLKVQAMKGATEEERLRARVALERITKDEQREQAEQAHQRNLARLEAERERKERQKQADLEALENRRQEEEKTHNQNMKSLEEQAAAVKRKQKEDEKAIDQDIASQKRAAKEDEKKYEQAIAAEKKKGAAEEKRIEGEIKKIREDADLKVKQLKQQTKDAQVNVNNAVDGQIKREEYVQRLLNEQLRLKREIARVQANSNSGGSGSSSGGAPPPRPGYYGPGYFTGGPIPGGLRATVNEIGQEAFLGRSGRLSLINAPAFGQWRAPESGVVIPAHITAGLNIPRGGVNVGRGINTARQAAGGSIGGSIAKLLAGGLGAPQGRITNNVTIQSQQPVNDASRLLVEMSRLKARRR